MHSNNNRLLAGRYGIFIATLLVFLSRLPFLYAGYGSEEDAMGMALTARNIAQTGMYEFSRLPGHPVPELVYAAISDSGPFYFNLVTAVVSTIGILFFMFALQLAGIRHVILAGIALAFTPVVYIASTNAMDYTWAMAFILICFYLLLSQKPVMAGIALGLAVGCRITSGGMLLPFLLLCTASGSAFKLNKSALWFCSSTLLTGIIVFLPAIDRYGLSFFDFYETVYPSFPKAFYKFTIAVFGTTGFLAMVMITGRYLLFRMKRKKPFADTGFHGKLATISVITLLLYALLYWYLPQKAAFMIPCLPFVFLLFALFENERYFFFLTAALVISCFFLGVNLHDVYRGGIPSAVAIPFKAGNQQVIFDPLRGTVTDDYGKRKQRLAFAKNIVSITDTLHDKSAVIAGWWLGDILVQQDPARKRNSVFYYYAPQKTLDSLQHLGYNILFLPEQDFFNDEKQGYSFTNRYGKLIK